MNQIIERLDKREVESKYPTNNFETEINNIVYRYIDALDYQIEHNEVSTDVKVNLLAVTSCIITNQQSKPHSLPDKSDICLASKNNKNNLLFIPVDYPNNKLGITALGFDHLAGSQIIDVFSNNPDINDIDPNEIANVVLKTFRLVTEKSGPMIYRLENLQLRAPEELHAILEAFNLHSERRQYLQSILLPYLKLIRSKSEVLQNGFNMRLLVCNS